MTQGEQDGYTSDHEYNVTDIVLVCGQRGFVAVMEFPVPRGTKVDSATLVMQVVKVDKPGEVALYHLLNFNNGYAETQDFYASAEKVGQIEVQKPGEISFPVGKYLKKDAQGPGGFSSYRLESLGAQIMLSAFESGKDKAKINVQ